MAVHFVKVITQCFYKCTVCNAKFSDFTFQSLLVRDFLAIQMAADLPGKSIVLCSVSMLRKTKTMEVHLVSLLPPTIQKSLIRTRSAFKRSFISKRSCMLWRVDGRTSASSFDNVFEVTIMATFRSVLSSLENNASIWDYTKADSIAQRLLENTSMINHLYESQKDWDIMN